MSDLSVDAAGKVCDCCDGVEARTPAALYNRRGLSAIAYRIGEYGDFRESMIAGLSTARYKGLNALRTRETDDYTIALLDAVACAADVLTFYQERIANESYLQTATERVSLQEMAKLIGYRLRPGVAAETRLAFALDRPTSSPSTLPTEPGAFVSPTPKELQLAAGLKVQSVPGPDERPQIFETVEAIAARPEWNAIRPRMSMSRPLVRGDDCVYIRGVNNSIDVGDMLAFVGPSFFSNPDSNTNREFRRIAAVEVESTENRTCVSWKEKLERPLAGHVYEPDVYIFRRRVAAFGNSAPEWRSMTRDFRSDYVRDENGAVNEVEVTGKEWPRFAMSLATATDHGGSIDLDAVYPGIKSGSLLFLTRDDQVDRDAGDPASAEDTSNNEISSNTEPNPADVQKQLFFVRKVSEVSRSQYAISGRVTRLVIAGAFYRTSFLERVRQTTAYVQSVRLSPAPYPITDAVTGAVLPLDVPADGLNVDRAIIVRGNRADNGAAVVHHATIVSVQSVTGGADLAISPPLPFALERGSVVVHANVAAATHGDTGAQILGSGDASTRFQRFELKRLPLTYRSAGNERGADSELTVRVGGIEWNEKPTLFEATPNERAYTLETDEQGKNWIVFGDGVRGARLPTGANNVRAQYRQGLGRDGNVRANQLSQLLTKPLGLKGVTNPASAEGGTDPEPASQARRTMSLGTRTLGRAVSLLDYEDFALAFTGIGKAQAQVLALAGGSTIVITIAGSDGSPIATCNPVWTNLSQALRAGGDPNVPFALMSYQPATFRLGLKVKSDPAFESATVLAAVETALRTAFGFDARSLAQPVRQSELIAVAHAVPGVVAVDVDLLRRNSGLKGETPSVATRLLASRARVHNGFSMPAELLLLDSAPLAQLEVMS